MSFCRLRPRTPSPPLVLLTLMTSLFAQGCLAVQLECRQLDLPSQENICFVSDIPDDLSREPIRIWTRDPYLLHIVNFRNVNLGKLPGNLKRDLPAVQWLTFDSCSIATLEGLSVPPSLSRLDVSGNMLSRLEDDSFVYAQSVTDFLARKNQIETIEEEFVRRTPRLALLDLSENLIKEIPEKLFLGTKLTAIKLSGNLIEDIKDRFQDMPKLAELHLDGNRIRNISKNDLVNCPVLRFVYFSGNEITFIDPEAFKALGQLSKLDLSQNRLSQVELVLPPSKAYFRIEKIDLSSNEIGEILLKSESEGTKLQSLVLSHNRINKFYIDDLIALGKLTIRDNSLTSLGQFTKLKYLKSLDLSANNLIKADLSVLSKPNLIELNVSRCDLSHVQIYELLKIPNLEVLDVSYNEVFLSMWTIFPNLSKIRTFYLNGVGLEGINPYEIKYAFPELSQIHLDGNKFKCDYFEKRLDAFKNVKISVESNGVSCEAR